MTAIDIASVLQCVLSMPKEDRSYITKKLIVSLDDDDVEVSQEWRDEINRRVESIRNGTAKLIPHEDVMANVRTRLAAIRKEKQAA